MCWTRPEQRTPTNDGIASYSPSPLCKCTSVKTLRRTDASSCVSTGLSSRRTAERPCNMKYNGSLINECFRFISIRRCVVHKTSRWTKSHFTFIRYEKSYLKNKQKIVYLTNVRRKILKIRNIPYKITHDALAFNRDLPLVRGYHIKVLTT